MDFGSSHVYAGGSENTYYSSVPKKQDENQGKDQQSKENILYDPIYESVEHALQTSNVQSADVSKAAEAQRNKPAIPEKPLKYRSLSLSDKLRKALDHRENHLLKKPSMPLPPTPLQSYNLIKTESLITSSPGALQTPTLTSKRTAQTFAVPDYQGATLKPEVAALEAWDSTSLNLSNKPTVVPNPYQEYAQQHLYPKLPSSETFKGCDDLKSNEPAVPSAPQLTLTKSSTTTRPSAPPMSQSMKRRYCDTSNGLFCTTEESVNNYADTNVVCIKLGVVGQSGLSHVVDGLPSQCLVCNASNLNSTGEWVCKFCGNSNISNCPQVPEVSSSDVTYILQHSQQQGLTNDSLIVFCIDTSGSMCVTSQVSSENSHFISRLESVKRAIEEQLKTISIGQPCARVALVTFNDMVELLGDGSPNQHMSLVDAQLYDYDFLRSVGSTTPLPGPISITREQLDNTVANLKERGGTALGPALLLSTSLASQRPGSQVIVCTDGRANIGIGSLETESDYQLCHYFYNEAAELASKTGVIVSILSIAGTDCRLVELGKVANRTSGKVNIVQPNEISNQFQDILTGTVLATNVSIDLVTHKQLFFCNSEGTTENKISQFVGNITNDSEATFRYGIKRDNEFTNVLPPRVAPFQLKILYRPPDGSVCMRVITEVRPVTEDRELAESEMNLAVVGAYASQSAAKLALEGDLDHAKEITEAHKTLLFRGMSLRSQADSVVSSRDEKIYESVKSKIDDIGRELAKVMISSSSEDQCLPDPTSCDVDVYQGVPDSNNISQPRVEPLPPALPPRGHVSQLPATSSSTRKAKSPSVSSIEEIISKLPSIPKGHIGKKKNKKNKKKLVEQYRDETAQKMFSFSKTTSSAIANIP